MILDLGCGPSKVPGSVGVDNANLPGVDVVHNLLDFPYPFDEGICTEIYLNHVLEHFDLVDGQKILREVSRILAPEGVVHIRVPHIFSIAAWVDPTHKRAFTFLSAEFFDHRSAKSYYKELDSCWKVIRISSRVTAFNWKNYRLRKLDTLLSKVFSWLLDKLLGLHSWPGAADLFVRAFPLFFVEIRWDFQKEAGNQ